MNTSSMEDLKRHEKRQNQRELIQQQKRLSGQYPLVTFPNRKSAYKTVDEEKEATQYTTEDALEVYTQLLPGLLKKLSRIPDPRQPKKIKHQMTVLMIYGILVFVFQVPSRRNANQEVTAPQLLENLKTIFPELTEMPHQDTLYRLLVGIDLEQLENIYLA
ncbi:MAG: transposase family protein [Bacillota bacterium]